MTVIEIKEKYGVTGASAVRLIWVYFGVALLTSTIFVIDIYTPGDIAVGVLYVCVLMVALWLPRHQHIAVLAAICSLMTVLGGALSSPDNAPIEASANRILALLIIWVVMLLSRQRQLLTGKAQERSNELRKAVKDLKIEAGQRELVEEEVALRTEELTASNAQLARKNQELNNFAYVASHDLKSPLRAIDSLCSWLEEDAAETLSPESQKHLQQIRQRIFRMETLLSDILEYSRIDKEEAQAEAVDLDALLDKIIGISDVPEGFTIKRHLEPHTLETFKTPLEQVMLNLVSNAIKHHDRQDGEITISAHDREGLHRIHRMR